MPSSLGSLVLGRAQTLLTTDGNETYTTRPQSVSGDEDGLTGALTVKVFPESWGAPGPTGPSAQALRGEGASTEGNASFGLSSWKGLITTDERKGMTMTPGM